MAPLRVHLPKIGGWSIAWRVHDAQFWGVPQRRKRISLVADFGGLSAPEISFIRKGLSGDFETGGAQRERTAAAAGCGPAYSIQGNTVDRDAHQNGLGISADIAHTLNAVDRHAVCTPLTFREREGKDGRGKGILCQEDKIGALTANNDQYLLAYPSTVNTLPARMDGSPCIDRGPPIIAVYENHGQDSRIRELGDVSEAVSAKYGTGGNNTPIVLSIGNGQLNQMSMEPIANTLDTMHDQQAVLIYAPDTGHALHAKANLQFREDSETYIVVWPEVRRLTPLETERLQGFPDDWSRYGINEKGVVYELSDSARFRLQGNSIARPFWRWLLRRIAAQYERTATLGSLFDGQAGFPLCWQEVGGETLWASEIEKNAVAVAKYHFPEK